MGLKLSKSKKNTTKRSTSKKRSFKKYRVNKNEYWCDFHKKMADIPEDLLGATDTASKMVEDILMEYQVNNEVCRAFHLTKKLDKLLEEINELKIGRTLAPQEEEALKKLNDRIHNEEVLQEIREANIHEKMYDETVNSLPCFDAYFMPTKGSLDALPKEKPAWRIDVRDIATLLKDIPDLPNLNGKLRMPSYLPSTSLGSVPRSLRAMSSIDPKSNPTTIDTLVAVVDDMEKGTIEDIPIMPELNARTFTRRVSKIEKDILREQIDALFGKMEEEFKEQKIDIAHDILKQIKELIKKGEFDEWVDFYINSRIDYKMLMDDIESFYKELVRVLAELDDEEGYSLDKARDDVIVKFKKCSKGRAALKFDAVVDVPIFELITLLQEPERYTSWSPYCAEAKEIMKLGRAGNVVSMKWDLPKPISAREGLMMGIGFNRMDVNGSVLVMSRTVDNDPNIMNRYDLPNPKSKHPKMDIEFSGVQLVPLSKNRTQFKFVVLSDPKVKLIPASLISWIARRGAGDMFDSMITAAKNIKGPSLEKSMAKNKEFYDWLQKLVDEYLSDKDEVPASSSVHEVKVNS